MTPQQRFDELAYYTLAHPDPRFVHQHAVDAFAAQHATVADKPIKAAFAFVGLYLKVERGYDGKAVQRVHMALARTKRTWPVFELPVVRGNLTVDDVLAAEAGPARDAAIDAWCASIWAACSGVRAQVIGLLDGVVPPAP